MDSVSICFEVIVHVSVDVTMIVLSTEMAWVRETVVWLQLRCIFIVFKINGMIDPKRYMMPIIYKFRLQNNSTPGYRPYIAFFISLSLAMTSTGLVAPVTF